MAFTGFIGWLPLARRDNQQARADVVLWTDAHTAGRAANTVGTSAEYANFRASIARVDHLAHYQAPAGAPLLMQASDGVEFGHFRLRAGVSEDELRAAHSHMLESHLQRQPGSSVINGMATPAGRRF